MECLYLPELESSQKEIEITGDEFIHLKALRINIGGKIEASNGSGLKAIMQVKEITKKKAVCTIESGVFQAQEERKISLALGILDSRDRFEFALEKAVELGIHSFIPLASDNSQRKKFSRERLIAKAVAALKQSKRYYMPLISEPLSLIQLLQTNNGTSFYFADMQTNEKLNIVGNNSIIIIGPEGGFSEREIELIKSINVKGFTLGSTRLRAETAAIASLTLAALG